MTRWLVIALGGAVGSLARYAMISGVQARFPGLFPWGTLSVNLVAGLLIGVVLGTAERADVGTTTRLLLVTGFLGGFSTFSAFTWETWALVRESDLLRALLYVGGSVGGALAAVILGWSLARLALS